MSAPMPPISPWHCVTLPLRPGAECPATGVLLDIEQFSSTSETGVVTYKNAICVFEHADNLPLRRHFDINGAGGFNFVSSTPGVHLVVRWIATVYVRCCGARVLGRVGPLGALCKRPRPWRGVSEDCRRVAAPAT
jgi:hypothetical protein